MTDRVAQSSSQPDLVCFDTAGVAPAERFDHWRSFYPSIDMEPKRRTDRKPFGGAASILVDRNDGTALSATTSGPNRARFNDTVSDNVLIGFFAKGEAIAKSRRTGEEIRIPRGRLYILDLVNAPDTYTEGFTNLYLSMPRERAMAALGGEPAAGHGMRALPDTGLSRVLRSHLSATTREMRGLSPSQHGHLLDSTASLATAYLDQVGSESAGPGGADDADILIAVQRTMEKILHDPDVTAETLARMTGQSRSRLYRCFDGQDLGVRETLTRLRMEKAGSLLALTSMPIGDIALHCGYGDFAAFSRAFRRAYDMTPRDYRRQHRCLSG